MKSCQLVSPWQTLTAGQCGWGYMLLYAIGPSLSIRSEGASSELDFKLVQHALKLAWDVSVTCVLIHGRYPVRTARRLVPSASRSMVSRHLHRGHRELNVAGFPSSQVGAARVDVPLVLLRVCTFKGFSANPTANGRLPRWLVLAEALGGHSRGPCRQLAPRLPSSRSCR